MATVAEQISYTDLYARWEKGNWRATEIDFTEDRRQWHEEMTEFERRAALWNYALFFWGEDAVTDGLSPYIAAAPTEEQKYFLATQQVDEARHAVFFNRFMHEVCDLGDGTVGGGLEAIRPQLTWGFRQVFDRLDRMADELREDPSLPRLAAAITLYHVVIEATLAQPGQHFITSYLHDRDLLPGFREGMDRIAQDEQRHIAFGVKLLSDLAAGDPECRRAVADLLREVLPWTASVLVPPDWDLDYTRVFGFELEDIAQEGADSLETKLRSAGLPIEELPGPPIFAYGLPPETRVRNGLRLVQGGVLGEKNGPPKQRPRDDGGAVRVARGEHRAAQRARRAGHDPVGLRRCRAVASRGRQRRHAASSPDGVEAPTVTLRCRYEDWADVFAKREHPLRLAATRRLRPSGDMRWLWRARRMFPR